MNILATGTTAALSGTLPPTITVVLGRECHAGHLAAVSIDLAARFDARLIAIYVIPPSDGPRYAGGLTLESVIREAHARALAQAELVRREFEARAATRNVRLEWRCTRGEPTTAAILHARYSDLCIMEQEAAPDMPPTLRLLPEDVVLGAGRPVIIVPHQSRGVTVGSRVLVAWNGSREATRAVNDALPLLRAAEAVAVLAIRPESAPLDPMLHGEEPGADIALYLARHGVAPEVLVSCGPAAESDGACLFREASRWAADLVVMGAFGHSRLRERIFGGVTRYALDHAHVPVMFSA